MNIRFSAILVQKNHTIKNKLLDVKKAISKQDMDRFRDQGRGSGGGGMNGSNYSGNYGSNSNFGSSMGGGRNFGNNRGGGNWGKFTFCFTSILNLNQIRIEETVRAIFSINV